MDGYRGVIHDGLSSHAASGRLARHAGNWHDFIIRPFDFFPQNPVLTLPGVP
jgi:hypothetical protein